MRAAYKCEKCGRRMVLCEGAVFCPSCGGKLRVTVSAVGRAKRTFRMACAALCGAWSVMIYNGVTCGADTSTLLMYGAMLTVCFMGTGLLKIRHRRVRMYLRKRGYDEKVHKSRA